MNTKCKAYVEMTLAMAIVGSSVVVGKVITAGFPVFLALGLRFGISSLIMAPLVLKCSPGRWREGLLSVPHRRWWG